MNGGVFLPKQKRALTIPRHTTPDANAECPHHVLFHFNNSAFVGDTKRVRAGEISQKANVRCLPFNVILIPRS